MRRWCRGLARFLVSRTEEFRLVQGPSFRFVRSTLADRFEPVVRELANVKLEITLDESGASYFHDPRRFGPTNLCPARLEELMRGPALRRFEIAGDTKHERRHRVTRPIALSFFVPARGSPLAPRDDEPIFRSISGLDPI